MLRHTGAVVTGTAIITHPGGALDSEHQAHCTRFVLSAKVTLVSVVKSLMRANWKRNGKVCVFLSEAFLHLLQTQ